MSNRRSRRLRKLSATQQLLDYQLLEPRALMAGFSWNSLPSDSAITSLLSQLSSESPPVQTFSQSPRVVGSSTITSRTAQLTVQGSPSSGDERSLAYFWRAQAVPSGGSMHFSVNGSNAAKNTTVTFSRAGNYQILSRIVDQFGLARSSVINVQVVQTATSVVVRGAANQSVNPGSAVTTAGNNLRFTAQVLDQFGQPMSAQPAVAWSVVTRPTGSSPSLSATGNAATVNFDQAGDYLLRADSGTNNIQFTARVNPTLTRLTFNQVSGAAIASGETLPVNGRDLNVRIQGFDQFDDPIARLTPPTWSVVSRPQNGLARVTHTNDSVNFSFTRAGNYTIRCQTPSGPFELNFAVNQVTSSLNVAFSSANLNPARSNQLGIDRGNFTATAFDQFSQPMGTQPSFTWSLLTRPVNSNAWGINSGTTAEFQFDRVGSYVLRVSGDGVAAQFPIEIVSRLNSLVVGSLGGQALRSGDVSTVTRDTHSLTVRGLDQFGQEFARLPTLSLTTSSAPAGGTVAVSFSSEIASFRFTRAGNYTVVASSGSELFRFSFAVESTLSRLEILSNAGAVINSGSSIASNGSPTSFSIRGIDQFGQALASQPSVVWSVPSSPAGSTPTFNQNGNHFAISFERAGTYSLMATSGGLQSAISINIAQRLTSLQVTPGSLTLETSGAHQFSAQTLDQFGRPMSNQVTPTWTATGGIINSTGMFTAGTTAGNFSITARTGSLVRTVGVTINAPVIIDGFANADLRELVAGFYADSNISRTEMIEILRSAGDGGVVTATELADLRFVIASGSNYQMADHVRNLAGDVVNTNRANATFQGQPLGNLTAGSSDVRLNRLIDKWFLGMDLPTLTSSSVQYREASGSLFVGTPGLNDAKQGMLGNCYFIASLASIAARNPTAVQNMFIDNGDNTFTVRFFGGSYGSFIDSNRQISTGFTSGMGIADYVTVNRQLPVFSSGSFAYSNYGLSSASTNVPLWIALAEKAYAQWNQTGNAGRDGTIQYASTEGGWMGDVNAQVLGYNSTMHHFTNGTASSLISALESGRAVTLGTRSITGIPDLVGSHAYTVSGYNVNTGRFTLHNPWGVSHPAPLTWSQLVTSCSAFVIVNPMSGGVSSAASWTASLGLQTWVASGMETSEIAASATADSGANSTDAGRYAEPTHFAPVIDGEAGLRVEQPVDSRESESWAAEWDRSSRRSDSPTFSEGERWFRDLYFTDLGSLTS